MEVQVSGNVQARRLELDGYSRTGDKTVMAPFEQLPELLDREDVTIRQVALQRHFDSDEADVIDHYVRNQVADDGAVYATAFTYGREGELKTDRRRSNKVLDASEDRLVVHSHFERALFDQDIDGDFYDMESFERVRGKALEKIEKEIKDHRSKLQMLEDRREQYQDIHPESVDQ